jgi:hypothetical protein
MDDGGSPQDSSTPVRPHRYMLPMHANWFGFYSIHNHERQALPELFNSSVPGFNISVRWGPNAQGRRGGGGNAPASGAWASESRR